MESHKAGQMRKAIAILLPFVICGVQWQCWSLIKPFVWFLFFPAVFFSSRIGGWKAGITATVISATLVVYFFIPPQLSFSDKSAGNLASVMLFLIMGALFSLTHDSLEKAKRRASSALEESRVANERLLEANDQVTKLYRKTLKLDELKTQFFSNVSHELRTPLSLILGPAGRRLADRGLVGEARRDLEVIERNARMLYRLVSDILDVAKLEAGRMPLRYSIVDLGTLVRFVASNFDTRATEKSIRYATVAPDTLLSQVDPEKCRRILLNLLANAFKFTPAGGEITVVLRECGGSAVIEVRDNGPGIPADQREAIFERFRQVDGGSERRFGGTGLGLAIVKELVALHGGEVELMDAPGGGTVFVVSLPLAPPAGTFIHESEAEDDEFFERMIPENEPRPQEERPATAPPDAPLILVVEDNPDMNHYLASLLRRHYRVATAFDGEEGLALALTLKPHLLVSDMMMPRMSGERLVKELRGHPDQDKLPIIMLTAKADDDLQVRMLTDGVQDYLTKPFSDAELMARVGAFLAERQRTSGELQKSEAQLHRQKVLLDRMSSLARVGGWSFDVATLEGSWTEEVARIHDLDPSRPITATEGITYYHPQARPVIAAAVQRAIEEALPYDLELRIVTAKGEEKWVRTQGEPVLSEGRVVRIEGAIQDITARKRAEEELDRLNADLELRVEERTAELQTANRELDAFAYAVSHDLRAPLRAMIGFSQALVEDYGKELQGESRTYLEQITIASRHMGELIDGLLTLSRTTRGELRHEFVDLSRLAELVRGELVQVEPNRPLAWEIEPGMAVRGDARMLEVVMRNLIGNAWKYTSGTPSPLIRVYSEERDATRSFCVADNGAGFNMGHSSRLFKPFQRLHRQDEFPGIGIGLATVQRIIHRHGGEISAQAEPGRGATFRFFLEGPTATNQQ